MAIDPDSSCVPDQSMCNHPASCACNNSVPQGEAPFPSAMASSPGSAVERLRQNTLRDAVFAAREISTWADDECLKRYLRARDQDVDKATAMLRATADWRSKNAIHAWLPARSAPVWPVVEAESATGKMFVLPAVNKDR